MRAFGTLRASILLSRSQWTLSRTHVHSGLAPRPGIATMLQSSDEVVISFVLEQTYSNVVLLADFDDEGSSAFG
jgi:hypothetical protein